MPRFRGGVAVAALLWLSAGGGEPLNASASAASTQSAQTRATQTRATQTPAVRGETPVDWQVQLVSEGGLAGKGLGSVGARSDGTVQLLERVAARDPALGGRLSYEPHCSMPLGAPQRALLAKAVAAAAPATWEARYGSKNPYVGGDEVLWTLTIERTFARRGVERRVVQWVSEREATLPEDLAILRKTLLSMKPAGACEM